MTLVSFGVSQFLTVNVLFFRNGPCYHSPLVAGTMTWGGPFSLWCHLESCVLYAWGLQSPDSSCCSPASPTVSPSQPANFPTTSGLQPHPANSSETQLWGENLPPPLLLSLRSFWTWGLFQSSFLPPPAGRRAASGRNAGKPAEEQCHWVVPTTREKPHQWIILCIKISQFKQPCVFCLLTNSDGYSH